MVRKRKTFEELEAQRIARCKKRENRAMTGKNFIADEPHEAFSSPNAYRRRVNMYFMLRDEDKAPQTIPGLCLFLGLRTKAFTAYDPGEGYEEFKRITDYAIQRIEAYTVEHLFATKGSTKGIEFLAMNVHGYATKNDNKETLEITEREKLKRMGTEQLKDRLEAVKEKINNVVEIKDARKKA